MLTNPHKRERERERGREFIFLMCKINGSTFIKMSDRKTLYSTLSLTFTLLLGEIIVGPTHRKWVPHKVVRPI